MPLCDLPPFTPNAMPCLFLAGALVLPRITIAYLWFVTNWFTGVFDSIMWPLIGFFFAPTTLLWYSVIENVYAGTWGTFQIVVMIIAVMIDLSPGTKKRKKQSD